MLGWHKLGGVNSTLSQDFGRLVRQLRVAAGLSQESLAQAADLHPTYISMVERGVRNPTLDVAERLARAFEMNLADLIKRAEQSRRVKSRRRE